MAESQLTANFLSAREALDAIRNGELKSEELVTDCLQRISELEPQIGAWAHLDSELALAQARMVDEHRQRGQPLGPLHGLPVGIKDIIDTADQPTECGSPIHAGREPAEDAAAVQWLREAGAVILGKTVTTEFATGASGKTRNPHDPSRTPGGSSSGSAAAVASFMAPLALGTQTGGSVIRPAAYCGVFGYKPSFGRISRYRIKPASQYTDTIGVFARNLDDVALLAEVLMRYDGRDPSVELRARPRLREVMAEVPPMPPHLAFVRSPYWDRAEETTKDALRELIGAVEERVDIVELPAVFAEAATLWDTIVEADLARNLAREYRDAKAQLSPRLRERIERGMHVTAVDYLNAQDQVASMREELTELFYEYDAILTPAATGEAPEGLESTGSPIFCSTWSLCGVPALNLPLLQGPAGLPLGVQLVGNRGDDARLMRTARWLLQSLQEGEESESGADAPNGKWQEEQTPHS